MRGDKEFNSAQLVWLFTVGLSLMMTISFCFGQMPPHRCLPPTFVVDNKILSTLVSSETRTLSIVKETLRIGFDEMSWSVGMFVNGTVSGSGEPHSYSYHYITDYNQKSRWMIDLQLQTCIKYRYTTRMRRCVPNTANLTDSFYIGSGDMFADEWTYITVEEQAIGTETMAILRDVIGVPLRSTFVGESGKDVLVASIEYDNYLDGIADPDKYFKLPDYCAVSKNNTAAKKLLSHRFQPIAGRIL